MRMMAWFGLAMVALVSFAPVFADAQQRAPRFDRGGCPPSFCSESDWIYDDNSSDHTTTWRHGLRATPRNVTILFTPDPNNGPVYPVMWSMTSSASGNPASISVGNRRVSLHISRTLPLRGIWTPETDWLRYNEGYWKIIVYR